MHLVLVGGGHAHMTLIARLDELVRRGHRVTLVSPSPYLYYSGMGPGLLGGFYRPAETRFHIRKAAVERGARFMEAKVSGVDPARRLLRLEGGGELAYDLVSFNTGSEVPLHRVGAEGDGVIPVKPIENLYAARRHIMEALRRRPLQLLVVGGGPAGVEIAANLCRLLDQSAGRGSIVLVGGGGILRGLPPRARALALASLRRRGVEVREEERAISVRGGRAELCGGAVLPYDFAFIAPGIVPSPIFRDSPVPTSDDGGLLVNPFLQSVAWPEIFGGGDCVTFAQRPLDKVGVYAVRQNPILHHNLLAALEGGEMKRFAPQKHYMLVFNLGDGRGILRRRSLVLDGRAAFRLKDAIDRRFMRRFQLSGELSEPNAAP